MQQKGKWQVYVAIINLHDINGSLYNDSEHSELNTTEYTEDEYGIELGVRNSETGQVTERKIMINREDRSKETCEAKVKSILLGYQKNVNHANLN